ncbi:hypothetical protein LTR65_002348 [Meristemomyces frigidus]
MGPIFESSDGNLVYLGEDNGLTEQAFESVYALADEIKDEVGEQDFTNFIRDEHGAVKISSKALGCGINEDALLDLYDRPWFTKLSDNLFALLGLHQRFEEVEADTSTSSSLLEPDYAKSPVEVLRDATRFAIIEDQSLEILRFPPFRSIAAQLRLPSWVPSWFGENDPGYDPSPLSNAFDSCDGLPSLRSNTQLTKGRDDVLPLSGISVDSVNGSTVVMTRETLLDLHELSALLVQISELATKAKMVSENTANSSVVGETLAAGRGSSFGLRSSEEILQGYDAFRDYILDRREYPPALGKVREADDQAKRARPYYDSMYNACYDRQFFTTHNGNIGLGPPGLQLGDLVTVLQGGKWPFILRPAGDSYKMIGVAYIHSIMYGEAVAEAARLGEPIVTFNLI